MRCMECDRPSLNPLEFLWKNFLPLVVKEQHDMVSGTGGVYNINIATHHANLCSL